MKEVLDIHLLMGPNKQVLGPAVFKLLQFSFLFRLSGISGGGGRGRRKNTFTES